MDLESRLLPTNSVRAEYARADHYVETPQGVTPAHILDPDFWQHIAARFRVNDRIEVVAADGSFDAELRVTAIDPRKLWAQVRLLRICTGEGIAAGRASASGPAPVERPAADHAGYVVEPDGLGKHRIVQGSDLIAKGFPDKAAAEAALANLKALKPKAAKAAA